MRLFQAIFIISFSRASLGPDHDDTDFGRLSLRDRQ